MPPTSDTIPETADVETASDGYAARFGGAMGIWMLRRQEKIVRRFLRPYPSATVLDDGGGHNQLAEPLCRTGYFVTVLGSASVCGRRFAQEVAAGRICFDVGNLVALPYPNRHFTVSLAIRLLPHCARWPELVSELCRTAKHLVIVDYPRSRSVNLLADILFGLKRRIEGNTRPYRLFNDREVRDAFAAHGFDLRQHCPQFFFPMVLHRVLHFPALSAALEGAARITGLTALFGSPVLACFKRRDVNA